MDSNHRPSGYEPDELPLLHAALSPVHRPCLPGSHLPSTRGAVLFHGPVRDGTGWDQHALDTPAFVSCSPCTRCLCSSCRAPSVVGAAHTHRVTPDQASPRSSVPLTSTPHGA